MTTFQQARAFLLQHRTDYDAAVEGFPLARSGAVQLGAGLVRCGTGARRRQQGSPGAVDRRCRQQPGNKAFVRGAVAPLQPGREFPARAGPQARRSSVAAARQCRSVVGDHAGGDQARRGGDPRDHAADAGRIARPARSRPRQGRGGVAGPGREIRRPRRRRSHSYRRRRVVEARGLAAVTSRRRIFRKRSRRMARPRPTIRCCCISPPAPRQSRNWCGTASAAIPSADCRRCTGSGCSRAMSI